MGQLFAIAIGGAVGSVLRYLVASGVYQWLGRDFPYGTLTVNVIGCLLIGLLAEALMLQRLAMTLEFRAAVMVGVFGGFTTFSTFSLETIYLLEDGGILKALLNAAISVSLCLFATWLGLLISRTLFLYSNGVISWLGWSLPYALAAINAFGAFVIGLMAALLLQKTALSLEYRAAILVLLAGGFATISSLYLVLHFIESGQHFESSLSTMLAVFVANALLCIGALWLGLLAGKQL